MRQVTSAPSGRVDLAIGSTAGVSVALASGIGTFQSPGLPTSGGDPRDMVAGDFTGDGQLDLAIANEDGTISILLGNGDGTFQAAEQIQLGFHVTALVAGDFNNDGRLDLVVADGFYPGDFGYGEVADAGGLYILLGNGDGTFQPPTQIASGGRPDGLLAGDFRNDGKLDLIEQAPYQNASGEYGTFVLLGNGDGTFEAPQWIASVYGQQETLANLTGNLDLVALGGIYPGNGDGTFGTGFGTVIVNGDPTVAATGDFNGDGNLDLAEVINTSIYSSYSSEIAILEGNGKGGFYYAQNVHLGDILPTHIVAGDFTGNGKIDLAVSGFGLPYILVILGNGDGTFQVPQEVPVGSNPESILTGDFNGDGKLDLAVLNTGDNDVSVLLGDGDGTFSHGGACHEPACRPCGGRCQWQRHGRCSGGRWRRRHPLSAGHPRKAREFRAPGHHQPCAGWECRESLCFRDIAWVPETPDGPVLASVDAYDAAMTFYAWRNGALVRMASLTTGTLPAQIVVADLDGTGSDDLIVNNAGNGTLSIFYGASDSTVAALSVPGPNNAALFRYSVAVAVGAGVSDVQAIDTTGSGLLDLVVTNELTGQLSILRNLGDGKFASPVVYRAGAGPSAVDQGLDSTTVVSQEATAGVAAFTVDGTTDLVTINPGSDAIDFFAGLGGGRFANPVALQTASPALIVRVDDFNHDGIPDLAVLTTTGVSIYLGNGTGAFAAPVTYDAGADPSGLALSDLSNDSNADLLIGNSYGDVLVLVGQGDGKFASYREANQSIELAVADLTGDGSKDVIYADQGLDQVAVDYGAGNRAVLADQSTGLLEPGAVQLAYLAGPDYPPDLIVANSGSNNVLIYPGLGNGQFGRAINEGNGYFVGTNPVGITVANLTGVLPDLVIADKGSNEVSILLNTTEGGNISFTAGPRLNAGAQGRSRRSSAISRGASTRTCWSPTAGRTTSRS